MHDTQATANANSSGAKAIAFALLFFALLLTFLAYSPILFNFFAGDDFVHLIWLKEAVKHTDLIWRNFYTSWLDGTTTKFYRPLISVFMVSDYVLWRGDGTGFHLTNLLFHLTSTAFIFLIGRSLADIVQDSQSGSSSSSSSSADPLLHYLWPFAAAAIFGLYPLHTETVSWITGRVDAIVTAFITGSLWFYLQARKTTAPKAASAACAITMILALLSKEMAITLPAIFVMLEIIFPRSNQAGLRLISLAKALAVLKDTALYWGIIVVYFIVRRIALGTFVGGYDDSLFFISNPAGFIRTWLNGLRLLFEPLNHELISARALPTKLWDGFLALLAVRSIGNILFADRLRKIYLFLAGWTIFSLAPVYKIFAIADDLQGSRLAYLATVPLSMLFGLGFVFAAKHTSKMRLALASTAALGFVFLCYHVLDLNNQAWINAGKEANAIRAGLSRLYQRIEGDPQILFVGLPDQINGAYICRNALVGMTRSPQLERDAVNSIMVDKFEPIMPFGYMKESLYKDRDKIHVFRWSAADKPGAQPDFVTMDLSAIAEYPVNQELKYEGDGLKAVLKPDNDQCQYSFVSDGGKTVLKVDGNTGKRGFPKIVFDPGPLPCYTIEFVTVKLKQAEGSEQFKAMAKKQAVALLYSNDLVNTFDYKRRTPTPMPTEAGEQTLIFALRSLPEWSLGGQSHGLTLQLPHDSHCLIESVAITPARTLIPQFSFNNSGYLGTKGYLHLGKDKLEDTLTFDVSQIKDAQGVEMEITRPNLLFEEQNCMTKSRVAMTYSKFEGKSGTIELKREMFPALGIYQLRLWPLFKQGSGQQSRGPASDHIVISVDS